MERLRRSESGYAARFFGSRGWFMNCEPKLAEKIGIGDGANSGVTKAIEAIGVLLLSFFHTLRTLCDHSLYDYI